MSTLLRQRAVADPALSDEGETRRLPHGGLTLATGILWAVLLARPLLDYWASDQVRVGSVSLNAAGFVGLGAIAFFLYVAVRNRELVWPSISWAWVGVLAASGMATIVAEVNLGHRIGQEPVQELVRLVAIFAVFLLAANVARDAESVRRLFIVVGLSAVVPGTIGVIQLVTGHTAPPDQGFDLSRVVSTFTGPNACGEFLAVGALILVTVPRRDLSIPLRVVALTPILISLIATYSRTALALFALGFLILEFRRHKLLVVAMAILGIAVALLVPSVRERVQSGIDQATGGNGAAGVDTSSYQWRLDTWEQYWEKYRTRPVTGFGLRSSIVVGPRKFRVPGSPPVPYDSHNAVLKVLFEGGIFLFLAWALLAAALIVQLSRLTRAEWPLAWQAQVLLVIWGLVILEGAIADDPLIATAEMYALFALTGAVLGASAVSAGLDQSARPDVETRR